nr:MAG TPA: hypothetical protein [Caudoviricetes sp.]
MAIKPILFNAEMVRAILDGRKACTRRILKGGIPFDEKAEYWNVLKKGEWSGPICVEHFIKYFSPYKPGDILYVRETWSEWTGGYLYKAWTEPFPQAGALPGVKWSPSIHMPKEAARIWLKVTDVRVDRLHDITSEQICREGTEVEEPFVLNGEEKRYAFSVLWNSTIKKSDLDRYGWEANPWVWVIQFERCEKPEEERR